MGAEYKLDGDDWLHILRVLLLALAAICSGGLLAWAISGRGMGLLLGTLALPVGVVWGSERLKIQMRCVLLLGWGASALVGVFLRVLPVALLVMVACLVVDDRLNRRRLKAAARAEQALRALAGIDRRGRPGSSRGN